MDKSKLSDWKPKSNCDFEELDGIESLVQSEILTLKDQSLNVIYTIQTQ